MRYFFTKITMFFRFLSTRKRKIYRFSIKKGEYTEIFPTFVIRNEIFCTIKIVRL